ncbi:MAG: 2-oxoacid:acceptor oxidoreductase family protein [Deltaproteobacteria bacterium]|nr:2-oxoacid:acceptor oxidoreductase family protein [Candidatus Anaeroferrophillus wilburensis]MBN2888657.1 2-oxoacid:acceptor oxidoreductase family protein [Deltaproteobacteria bacterium]
MIEVRVHGRGGQGGVTSAEMLAIAAINEGKYAQAFPSFGPERRGAPVVAFARVSETKIRNRTKVYAPDIVVVLDPSVLKIVDVEEGLKRDGLLVINSGKTIEDLRREFGFKTAMAQVDASSIAMEELGLPITNTTMLGALIKGWEIIPVEALVAPLEARFGRIAPRNIKAMMRAYEETIVAGKE